MIHAIYAWYVLETTVSFELTEPTLDEMAARRARVIEAGWPHLIAEGGGRVVGFAYATPFRDRAAYRHTVEHSVYVDPGALHRGIGRTLMDELIATCASAGAREMIGVIGDSENARSIAFHERMGFRRAGTLTRVGVKFGRRLDVVLMQRAI